MAVNALFGAPLDKAALVPAGLASEAAVSGYHADNIAPALLGGFILIRRGPAQCPELSSAALQVAWAPVLSSSTTCRSCLRAKPNCPALTDFYAGSAACGSPVHALRKVEL